MIELEIREGNVSLPTDVDTFTGNIIDELVIGPERRVATPTGPGVFRVIRDAANECEFNHSFEYAQGFLIPGDEMTEITLKLSQLEYGPSQCRFTTTAWSTNRYKLPTFQLTMNIFQRADRMSVTLVGLADVF